MSDAEQPGVSVPAPESTPVKEEKRPVRTTEGLTKLEASKRSETLNSMESIAQRSIALHLHSMGIKFTQESLDQLLDLMEIHLDTMMSDLQKVTHTQRRVKASPKDLKLLLKDYQIGTGVLEDEFLKTKKLSPDIIKKKEAMEKLADEAKSDTTTEPDAQNPAFVFFAHDEGIIRLVPPTNKGSSAILPWLPELPPDHTYRRTPKYTDRITDQKIVRAKVFEESKLGEKALDNLAKAIRPTEDDEIVEDVDMEFEVKEKEKEIEKPKEPQYDIFTAGRTHDIERYVKARLKYITEKRPAKDKRKFDKLADSKLISIISGLSAYGKDEGAMPSPDEYLEKQFKKTISTFKALKKEKEIREERRKVVQQEAAKKREEMLAEKEPDFDDFNNFDNFENFENFGESTAPKTAGDIFEFGAGNDSSSDVELLDAEPMVSDDVHVNGNGVMNGGSIVPEQTTTEPATVASIETAAAEALDALDAPHGQPQQQISVPQEDSDEDEDMLFNDVV